MAAGQAAKEEQVAQLKAEILALRRDYKRLGNPYMSREQLLTFDMLEHHPLVTDQVEYEFQWDQVDALYEFVDKLPAWVVDDEVMEVWRTGSEDAPQSFRGWEAKKAEWGQALMLSWSPARNGGGPTSPVAKVFTAVVVCIHPCQVVMSVKDAANDLLSHSVATLMRSMSTLCRLPRHSVGTFYPSPLNHSFLVLPYLGVCGGAKEVCLDLSVVLNKHMVVRHLHRYWTSGGWGRAAPYILEGPGHSWDTGSGVLGSPVGKFAVHHHCSCRGYWFMRRTTGHQRGDFLSWREECP